MVGKNELFKCPMVEFKKKKVEFFIAGLTFIVMNDNLGQTKSEISLTYCGLIIERKWQCCEVKSQGCQTAWVD